MDYNLYASIAALPILAVIAWLAQKLLGPTLDSLGAGIRDILSFLANHRTVALASSHELEELVKKNHTLNGHTRFNTRKTYLRDAEITSFVLSRSLLMRRAVMREWIKRSRIEGYSESDIFFAGMELFLNDLKKKDVLSIYKKFQENDQASLWPFLELIENERPKLLSLDVNQYLQRKKHEWYSRTDTARVDESLRVPPPGLPSRWSFNNFAKFNAVSFAMPIALLVTTFLYWPVYREIPLEAATSTIDQQINRLDLSLGDDFAQILDRGLQIPLNRHELCMRNENGFRFIHSDSNSSGVPFLFYTSDLNKSEFGRENKLGAMSVRLHYHDLLPADEIYREFDWPMACVVLEKEKLEKFASSTVEYGYIGINRLEEHDLGEKGKIAIMRAIMGGYSIDTSKSSLAIYARWEFFLLTFVFLFMAVFRLLKFLETRSIRFMHYFHIKERG